jgi:hypothetical protein
MNNSDILCDNDNNLQEFKNLINNYENNI